VKQVYHKAFGVQLAEVGHKTCFHLGRNSKLIRKVYADSSPASL